MERMCDTWVTHAFQMAFSPRRAQPHAKARQMEIGPTKKESQERSQAQQAERAAGAARTARGAPVHRQALPALARHARHALVQVVQPLVHIQHEGMEVGAPDGHPHPLCCCPYSCRWRDGVPCSCRCSGCAGLRLLRPGGGRGRQGRQGRQRRQGCGCSVEGVHQEGLA